MSRCDSCTFRARFRKREAEMKRIVISLFCSIFLLSCAAVNQGTIIDSLKNKEVLLLNMEGEDGSAVFLDSSNDPKKVKANGKAALSVEQAKFGKASGHFNGAGDYLTLEASPDWDFGTGDFTIDFWVKRTGLQNYAGIVCSVRQRDYVGFSVQIQRDGFVELASDADGSWGQDMITSRGIADETWTHVAVVRYGKMVTIYFDGAAVETKNVAGYNFTSASNKGGLTIGRLHPDVDNYYLKGFLDDVRVTKGVARWKKKFKPVGGQEEAGKAAILVIKSQEEYYEGLIGSDNLKQNEAVESFLESGNKGREFLITKKSLTTDEKIIWKIDAILSRMNQYDKGFFKN